ncbi:DMT family transporter [Agarivorans sp. Toyoura001]|uniref:DMT family transporter n=1 Tax=Agarivorans sp. Toyoura001 TaxID=2283141 RepID=UPI002101D861|nr:DMT family transporter [Agarivorans sp. Toyoura001]
MVSKLAVGNIEPATLAFYRCFVALVVMTSLVLPAAVRQWQAIKSNLSYLLILAATGMVLSQTMTYFSAYHTSAAKMSLINSMIPIVSIVFSAMLLQTSVRAYQSLGIAISLIDVGFIVSSGEVLQVLSTPLNRGDLMMGVGTLSYGFYTVLLKKWPVTLSGAVLIYVQLFLGSLMLLPNMLVMSESVVPSQKAIPLVLYASCALSMVAPWLWKRSIDRVGGMKTSLSMNLMPVLVFMISYLFLDERFELYHLWGTLLILSGLLIVQFRSLIKMYRGKKG